MSKNKIRYPLVKPFIESQEINNVMSALKSGWISANGAFVPKFEKLFSKYLKGGHALAVSSGTSALQLGLATLGIGKGDTKKIAELRASQKALISLNVS